MHFYFYDAFDIKHVTAQYYLYDAIDKISRAFFLLLILTSIRSSILGDSHRMNTLRIMQYI